MKSCFYTVTYKGAYIHVSYSAQEGRELFVVQFSDDRPNAYPNTMLGAKRLISKSLAF